MMSRTESDEQIARIFSSGKTLMPAFNKPHNWLRMQSRLYYKWHLNKYFKHVHLSILAVYSITVLKIVAGAFLIAASIPQYAHAATKQWTDQSDFSIWTKSQTSSNATPGDLTLDGTSTDVITATTATNNNAIGVDISSDGSFAYVAHSGSNNLTRIRTSDNTVTATIGLADSALDVMISPDNSFAYVTYLGGNMARVRTSDNTLVTTISIGGGYGIDFSSDGSFAYVAMNGSNTVKRIRTSDNTVTATINVGSNPNYVDISPDGSFAYVTNANANTISRIRTSDNTVTATVTLDSSPSGVRISPNSTFAYVTTGSLIKRIRTSDNIVTASFTGGTWLSDIDFAPDGSFAYGVNNTFSGGGSISRIRTSDNFWTNTIASNQNARSIDFAPDGSFAYVSHHIPAGGISRIEPNIYTYSTAGTASVNFDSSNTFSKWNSLTRAQTTNSQTINYYGAASINASCPTVPTTVNAGASSNWTSNGWSSLSFSGNSVDLTGFTYNQYFCIGTYLATSNTTATPSIQSLSLDYTQDTAPSIAITAPTGSPTYLTNASSIILGGTANDDLGLTSIITSPSSTVTGTSTWSTNAINLSEGSNVITVTATDSSGQTSNDSITVTRDSQGPNTSSITSPEDTSTITDTTPTITSSTYSDSLSTHQATQWQLDDNSDFSSTLIDTGDDTTNLTNYTVSNGNALSDGTYYIRTRYKDAADNYSSYSSASSFIVNIGGPVFSSISSSSNNSNTSIARIGDSITVSFTSSEDLLANPSVTLGGQAMNYVSNSGLDYIYTRTVTGAENEGSAAIEISGTDTFSNPGTGTSSFTLDFTNPSFISINTSSNNTNSPTLAKSGDIVTTTFTASESLQANPTVIIGGSPMSFVSKNGLDYTYARTLTGTENSGNSVILISDLDTASNQGTNNTTTFPTDFSRPNSPSVTSPSSPMSTNSTTYSITGAAEANSLVTIYTDPNNDGLYGDGIVSGTQQLSGGATDYSIQVNLSTNTTHHFLTTATDTAGNQSNAGNVPDITTDTIPPAAPTSINPSQNITVNSNTYTLTGQAEADDLVQIFKDAIMVASQQLSGGSTNYSIQVTLDQNSLNNFTVKANDPAGNQSTVTTPPTITEDSTGPLFSAISASSNNSTSSQADQGNIVTVTFHVDEPLFNDPTVLLGGNPMTFQSENNRTYTYTRTISNDDSAGTIPINISGTDDYSNTTTNSNTSFLLVFASSPTPEPSTEPTPSPSPTPTPSPSTSPTTSPSPIPTTSPNTSIKLLSVENLNGTVQVKSILLTFTKPADGSRIIINRSTEPGVTGSQIGQTTGSEFKDDSVEEGIKYYYTLWILDPASGQHSDSVTISVVFAVGNVDTALVKNTVQKNILNEKAHVILSESLNFVQSSTGATGIALAGAGAVAAVSVAQASAAAATGGLSPIRFFDFIFFLFKPRKKKNYWGMIYDQETKLPVVGAIIGLVPTQMLKSAFQTVTGPSGGYHFPPIIEGMYQVGISAPGYSSFVSEAQHFTINGPTKPDTLYLVKQTSHSEVATSLKRGKEWQTLLSLIKNISTLLFLAGYALALYNIIVTPSWLQYLLIAAYTLLFISIIVEYFKPRISGTVLDEHGQLLQEAAVKVYLMSKQEKILIASSITGKDGAYSFRVSGGKFYIISAEYPGYATFISHPTKIGRGSNPHITATLNEGTFRVI